MCRSFLDRPVPAGTVDRLIERARRAPSAGHSQGWDWLVLEGRTQTRRFFELDADRRWLERPDHPGLLAAPVIVVPLADRQAYLDRYREADKSASGAGPEDWHVPYWLTDTAFATMLLLLGVVEEGLGALLFRLHADPATTLSAFGVPAGHEALGAVAIGWPDPSAAGAPARPRPRRSLASQVHRGTW